MKRMVLLLAMMIMGLCLAAGCTDGDLPVSSSAPQISKSPDTISSDITSDAAIEKDAVQLIRSMMELDYADMSVADFNQAIQQICADADTTVFDAISYTYDYYAVYDDTGVYTGAVFTDRDLERFFKTTLSYSSQEIFGEPVHMDSIMYMTTPDMTALELDEKKEAMQPEEWDHYFNENIQKFNMFPVLSYEIEAVVQDEASVTVSERDSRIDGIHSAIKEYFLGLTPEAAASETLEEELTAEFERLSVRNSDEKISIECRIQAVERDLDTE